VSKLSAQTRRKQLGLVRQRCHGQLKIPTVDDSGDEKDLLVVRDPEQHAVFADPQAQPGPPSDERFDVEARTSGIGTEALECVGDASRLPLRKSVEIADCPAR
jgi:hypothetical protein